jgi:uncharacterized protein (DUF885 family)
MRQTIHFLLPLLMLSLAGCAPRVSEDQRFESLAGNYIEQLLRQNPELATGLGDHRFDGKLNDYSMKGVEESRALTLAYLDSLKAVRKDGLSPVNRIDYDILLDNLQYGLFQIDTLKDYEWNPLSYNFGGSVYALLARDFAPLKERLLSLRERMKSIPAVLAAAKANLKNPPRIHTETAILQNGGNLGLVQGELNTFLDQVPELKEEFAPIQSEAVKAIEEYGAWLQNDLLPRSNGDFRIGEQKYRRKLRFALESDLTKEDILTSGEKDLKEAQEEMYATALPMYRKFFPKRTDQKLLSDRKKVITAVLDKLAEQHPTNATIVEKAREALARATDFVREHNLVTVPTEPIKIIVMPEFQRGVAVAYCDPPGPLEKNGETFFSISPTPADWSPARVESFFREYNNYMLENLAIHEGVPGHYLQLAHSNMFHAPTMVRAVFFSGTFVEGWATYAEQLMVEEGFGGPELKMQQLKMRLRLIINAIIDQKIHTAGMTQQEAMDLMMREGFQEEGEAAGKWRRACLTSTQLSTYYVGNIELNNLRRAYEESKGGNVDLKTMHDAMIAHGSPAPKYVRIAMGL